VPDNQDFNHATTPLEIVIFLRFFSKLRKIESNFSKKIILGLFDLRD
jgi:hypothetical protein